jgi:hypothetical protein
MMNGFFDVLSSLGITNENQNNVAWTGLRMKQIFKRIFF